MRLTFVFETDIIALLIRGLAIKKSFKWDRTVSGLIPLFVFTRGEGLQGFALFLVIGGYLYERKNKIIDRQHSSCAWRTVCDLSLQC